MKKIIFLLLFCTQLPACAFFTKSISLVQEGNIQSYDGISKEFPTDARAFAEEAALELAKRYPPARTVLYLVKTEGVFSESFENKLRSLGFSFGVNQGLKVGYVVDVVLEENKAYTQISLNDNTKFGFVKSLGLKSYEQIPVPTFEFETPATSLSLQPMLPDNTTLAEASITSVSENVSALGNSTTHSTPTQDTVDNAVTYALQEIEASPLYQVIPAPQSLDKVWAIYPGSLLQQLEEWGQSEGWLVIWNSHFDLDMQASASFTGTFIKAVESLFSGLQNTKNNLRVTIYQANKVLEVTGD